MSSMSTETAFQCSHQELFLNRNNLEGGTHMSRKKYSLTQQLVMGTTLALGASGVALADDSSMSRIGGESYAYFNRSVLGNAAAEPEWRRSHPNGLSERELQAYSSNDLSVFASQMNPPIVASVPADPSWRQSHPNGLTEAELMALSSGPPSRWRQDASRATTVQSNVAQEAGSETSTRQVANVFRYSK